MNDDIYGISENGLVVTRYANFSRGRDLVKSVLTEAVVSYEIRQFASVINFQNKAIFVTGGQHKRKKHDG